jgi:hypothetical protein
MAKKKETGKLNRLPFGERLVDLHVMVFREDVEKIRAFARAGGYSFSGFLRARFRQWVASLGELQTPEEPKP